MHIHSLPIQLLDLANPKNKNYVTLGDLKRCNNTTAFFNTLFNFERYMALENDPNEAKVNKDISYIVSYLLLFISKYSLY